MAALPWKDGKAPLPVKDRPKCAYCREPLRPRVYRVHEKQTDDHGTRTVPIAREVRADRCLLAYLSSLLVTPCRVVPNPLVLPSKHSRFLGEKKVNKKWLTERLWYHMEAAKEELARRRRVEANDEFIQTAILILPDGTEQELSLA